MKTSVVGGKDLATGQHQPSAFSPSPSLARNDAPVACRRRWRAKQRQAEIIVSWFGRSH